MRRNKGGWVSCPILCNTGITMTRGGHVQEQERKEGAGSRARGTLLDWSSIRSRSRSSSRSRSRNNSRSRSRSRNRSRIRSVQPMTGGCQRCQTLSAHHRPPGISSHQQHEERNLQHLQKKTAIFLNIFFIRQLKGLFLIGILSLIEDIYKGLFKYYVITQRNFFLQ